LPQRAFYLTLLILLLLVPLQPTSRLTLADKAQTEVTVCPKRQVAFPKTLVEVSVSVANVSDLFAWQVALGYNASILAWFSFQGGTVFSGERHHPEYVVEMGSTIDGLNYMVWNSSLISGSGLNSSNSTLICLSFLTRGCGDTPIIIGTARNPITTASRSRSWDSALLDSSGRGISFTVETDGLVSVGRTNDTVSPKDVGPPTDSVIGIHGAGPC
jgi:hypothetical protein